MNLINNNPFRILGLPITASEREIAKQINTLATFAEMGKRKSFNTEFPFLPFVERTPEAIEEAKKQIEQSESKLLYSLFWFWNNNSVDELAFEVLKEGKTAKAIDIWEKASFTNKHKIYKPIVLNENLIISSSHFANEDDEDHSLKKNDNEYLVERKKETDNYSIPTAFYDLNFDENWTIECDATWLAGIDNSSYGIVFGREKGSYYFFGIAGSGSYIYAKYNDWTFNSYIDWKENDNFKKWGSNKLRIEKIENTLKFFINDEYVNTWQAEPFFGKFFGFKVSKNQKISFRNFKFCKLVEDDSYGEGLNVSSKNFSNIKNLSTLYLGLAVASTKGTFKLNHFSKGIILAKNIFTNGNMNEYAKLIAGDRYDYNSEKSLHFYINDILDSVKPFLDTTDGISSNELVNSFATFPIEAKQFLNNKFVAKQIQNIDKQIEISKTKRKKTASTATDSGRTLVKNTKEDLDYLRKTLGKEDVQYQTIADKLSQEIGHCGTDAFYECKDEQGEIDDSKRIKSEESYLPEYQYALNIAVTHHAKEKAKHNLDICLDYIKRKYQLTCWFCEKNLPDKDCKIELTVYNETSRDDEGVNYQYLPINIPRCKKCKKFHELEFNFGWSNMSDFYLLLILIGRIIEGIVFIVKYSYCFIAKFISIKLDPSKASIKKNNFSTLLEYPLIKEKLKDGWTTSKPRAYYKLRI